MYLCGWCCFSNWTISPAISQATTLFKEMLLLQQAPRTTRGIHQSPAPHQDLGPPTSIKNNNKKKAPCRLLYRPIQSGHFLNWGSLLHNGSSLYQVDIKVASPIIVNNRLLVNAHCWAGHCLLILSLLMVLGTKPKMGAQRYSYFTEGKVEAQTGYGTFSRTRDG